jgi:ABC-type dipeptide/oligopeptide/nickel transport system permease component
MILGIIMVTGIFVILCNLAADVGYAFLDPRIRLGR